MDTLNALTIELNAELDEVRRTFRKLVCERHAGDIAWELGLLRAILMGIWEEAMETYDFTLEKLVRDTLEELIAVKYTFTIKGTYKMLRKALRLSQYLNERPF